MKKTHLSQSINASSSKPDTHAFLESLKNIFKIALLSGIFYGSPAHAQQTTIQKNTGKNTNASNDSSQGFSFFVQSKQHLDTKDTLTFSHAQLITKPADDIDTLYGEPRGLEIIRESMLAELNNLRKKIQKHELVFDTYLNGKAQSHAKYMYDNNCYSHIQKDGKGLTQRVNNDTIFYFPLAENIALGNMSISAVLNKRMNSPGHKANILDTPYTGTLATNKAGVGYYKGYRVLVLGGK